MAEVTAVAQFNARKMQLTYVQAAQHTAHARKDVDGL